MASMSAQRLGGVLMTDQRSASEAVMIMWLAASQDSALAPALDRHVIIGALHISRGETGLEFDTESIPLLSVDGAPMTLLEGPDLTEQMNSVLRRLRARLKSREASAETAVLGALADRLVFYIYEVGDEAVGPGWTVDYAGRTYPMRAASGVAL